MLDIIYYYYYLFYLRMLKDNEPHLLTTLALSFSISTIIIFFIDVISVYVFCFLDVNTWHDMLIYLLSLGILYLWFHKTGRAKKVVKEKPKLFNNHFLSIVITISFFIISISFYFWLIDVLKLEVESCR